MQQQADQATIFNADQAATQSDATQTTATQQAELVAALVGEGKKYKTVDDLAKAYISADDFIEQLKAENRELREKTTAAKTIDDVLERLQQQQTTQTDDNRAEQPSGVPVADIAKLVEQTVTGLETKKQKESNLLKADRLMKEQFGDKASEVFQRSAATPELQKVYMELAAADPDKFVTLFTGGAPKNSVSAEQGGSVNTTVTYSSTNGVRESTEGTKEYFDKIRRTNPTMYYSQEFQLKMDNLVRSKPDLYYGKR